MFLAGQRPALAAVAAFTIVPRLARRVDFAFLRLPFSFRITRGGGIYILGGLSPLPRRDQLREQPAFRHPGAPAFRHRHIGHLRPGFAARRDRFPRRSRKRLRGGPGLIRVTLRNRKRFLPSLSLNVAEEAAKERRRRKLGPAAPGAADARRPIMKHPAYFPAVLAGQSASELVVQSFPARGRHRLQGFVISTRFPFGLFQRGERFRAEGEILVYPEIQEISSYFHLLPFQPGRFEGKHAGKGESLYALRKYQDGESVRFMDWKATAKVGNLMSRQYSRDEEFRFCLILDTVADKSRSGPVRPASRRRSPSRRAWPPISPRRAPRSSS